MVGAGEGLVSPAVYSRRSEDPDSKKWRRSPVSPLRGPEPADPWTVLLPRVSLRGRLGAAHLLVP